MTNHGTDAASPLQQVRPQFVARSDTFSSNDGRCWQQQPPLLGSNSINPLQQGWPPFVARPAAAGSNRFRCWQQTLPNPCNKAAHPLYHGRPLLTTTSSADGSNIDLQTTHVCSMSMAATISTTCARGATRIVAMVGLGTIADASRGNTLRVSGRGRDRGQHACSRW
jgi:hypothetical protein